MILFLRGWLWLVGCAVAWDKQPYHDGVARNTLDLRLEFYRVPVFAIESLDIGRGL
ncbi:MAG: hypothetical protein ACI92G_004791, partial [Candidatus Pelagisphaera sp.]